MRSEPTRLRALGVAILSAGAVGCGAGLFAPTASAAVPSPSSSGSAAVTIRPPVVKTNWYWAEKKSAVAGNGAPALPDAADQAAQIPAGDLGVSLVSSAQNPADKLAAISFDLTTVPVQSAFGAFGLTLPLDPKATQSMSGTPELAACENIGAFTDGPGAQDMALAPQYAIASCVKGVFSAATGYHFDLTAMANDWAFGAPSYGVSIVPGTTSNGTPPYSLALGGKNLLVTSATYVGPAGEASLPPAYPAVPAVAPSPAPAPPPEPMRGAPDAAGIGLSPGTPMGSPVTAPGGPVPAPQVNVPPAAQPLHVRAIGYVTPSTTPTLAYWLALLLGLALMIATAVVFGDPLAPAPADARRRRFTTTSSLRPPPV